jgi:hypothetical protein
MFGDESVYKAHYEDWKQVLTKIKVPTRNEYGRATIAQVQHRVDTIKKIIKDYELSHQ